MFKIVKTTIHCSRGDRGTIILKLPITDINNYIKYIDASGNIFWYDTRGKKLYDSAYNISDLSITTLSMVLYQFKVGDKITFHIYEKNGYNKEPLVVKEVNVAEITDMVYISLEEKETIFGKPVNKPTVFWYDVTLNDNMTIIGYDEDDAKEFIEYPAKGDEE